MPYDQLDRMQLRVLPLCERQNKLAIAADHVSLDDPPTWLSKEGWEAVVATAERMRQARENGAPIMMAFGAHTIKNGLAPVLIRLMEEGWLDHLATNGAGIIHDWEFAYQLEGSWDVGFAKWVFESFKLADIEPVDLVGNEDSEIVVAADAARTKIVAYAPYTTSIEFDIDLSGYTCSCINLNDRRIWMPPVRTGKRSVIELPQFNHDMLFIAIEK